MNAIQFSTETLTNKAMKQATMSISGSIVYTKLMIRLSVVNILYNRIKFGDEAFTKHKMGDSNYMTVNRKISKSHALFSMHHLLRCAADEIEKRFLKQLYLVLLDKNSKNILEKYQFQITYDPADDGKVMPRGSAVIKMTADFFDGIHKLKEIAMLNFDEVEFGLQLITNENTPSFYAPQCFQSGAFLDQKNDISEYFFLGSVNTGYHKLSVGCFMSQDEASVESVSILSNDEPTSKKIRSASSVNGGTTECASTLFPSDDENVVFSCTCLFNRPFEKVQLIQCKSCLVYQHAPCQGFLWEDQKLTYNCLHCTSQEKLELPKYREEDFKLTGKRFLIKSSLRLFCFLCYTSNEVPMYLLEDIPVSLKNILMKIIKENDIFTIDESGDQEKYTPNLESIHNKIFPRFFYKPDSNGSMNLGGISYSETLN